MKYLTFTVLLVSTILGGLVLASDMLVEPTDQGCVTTAPFNWVWLQPGEKWTGRVDLRQCSDEQLGHFYYYGHIAKKTHSPVLMVRDGVVLEAIDIDTGKRYTCGSAKNGQESILMVVPDGSRFELSAMNTGKKEVKIRVTWNKVTVR